MLGSVKYNLRHLLDFSGRDARQTFWYYVLFVFLLNIAVGMVMVVPFIGQMIASMATAIETGSETAVQAAVASSMGEMMESMLWLGLFTTALNVALLAAALTRRLHDSGLPGWWGLLPLGLQAAATWYTFTRIDDYKALMGVMMSTTDPEVMMVAQNQISSQSALGWVAIIALILLGIRKSSEGPNRFGEAPVRF